MGKTLNNICNVIVAACDVYAKVKERELEQEAMEVVYASRKEVTRSDLLSAMLDQDWQDYEMKAILREELSDDQMEAALELIKSGKFRYYQILRVIDKF